MDCRCLRLLVWVGLLASVARTRTFAQEQGPPVVPAADSATGVWTPVSTAGLIAYFWFACETDGSFKAHVGGLSTGTYRLQGTLLRFTAEEHPEERIRLQFAGDTIVAKEPAAKGKKKSGLTGRFVWLGRGHPVAGHIVGLWRLEQSNMNSPVTMLFRRDGTFVARGEEEQKQEEPAGRCDEQTHLISGAEGTPAFRFRRVGANLELTDVSGKGKPILFEPDAMREAGGAEAGAAAGAKQ